LIDPIRDRHTFLRLRREGRRVRIDPLWCFYVPIPELQLPQVAFAIPRAAGTAVERNRLRRRLRAILRSCDVQPGIYLIGVHGRIPERTFVEWAESVHRLLARTACSG
jgi:ribonuclease P protein component